MSGYCRKPATKRTAREKILVKIKRIKWSINQASKIQMRLEKLQILAIQLANMDDKKEWNEEKALEIIKFVEALKSKLLTN